MCRVEGSEAFARELQHGQFKAYPGLRHEIFNEPVQGAIFQDVLDWVHAREGEAT